MDGMVRVRWNEYLGQTISVRVSSSWTANLCVRTFVHELNHVILPNIRVLRDGHEIISTPVVVAGLQDPRLSASQPKQIEIKKGMP